MLSAIQLLIERLDKKMRKQRPNAQLMIRENRYNNSKICRHFNGLQGDAEKYGIEHISPSKMSHISLELT
jgi:hypothetical protein